MVAGLDGLLVEELLELAVERGGSSSALEGSELLFVGRVVMARILRAALPVRLSSGS
ncbi:hypothetical protein Q0F99_14840 [Rathayibacter oskolensis]|uniref:hypothetical protein n=1 Tax=Rathayibacter oskolensis TaxID=1891671 RepID=UPI00265FF7DD|nr:hypothetical protein [Rathayibacter oskolensis]WKK70974.1 hypothetical protein Q0F99_14840 [Rathayibacter oskolensis]